MQHADAAHDALTGAASFQHLTQELRREFDRSSRYGRPLAIIRCDVDRLKLINNGFGREAGDEVLRALNDRSKRVLRQFDWIARVAEDEFIIVLPETDLAGAVVVAERVRKIIATRPFSSKAGPFKATISVGYTAVQTRLELHQCVMEDLLETSAEQLRVAIQKGRNTISGCGAKSSNRQASRPASGRGRASAPAPDEWMLVEYDGTPFENRRQN
jgi:two-component system, cell cycle response regulator